MADYSTPIRNAMILLMNGPAVEVAALDSRVPMQVQAEAQQKQCDYVLFSSVAGTSHHGRLYVPVDDRTLSKAHYRSTSQAKRRV